MARSTPPPARIVPTLAVVAVLVALVLLETAVPIVSRALAAVMP